jgi:hypothetical protein
MRPITTTLALVALVACNAAPLVVEQPARVGPSSHEEERAYSLVWEGTFAMERESRPSTTWIADCANPSPRLECVIGYLAPDGDITITWREGRGGAPRISGTPWIEMLGGWRTYLLTGRRGEPDAELARRARDVLGAAGL